MSNDQAFVMALQQLINDISAAGFNPSALQQKIANHGHLKAVKMLLFRNTSGYRNLVQAGRFDLTLEALVLRFPGLFSLNEIQQALNKQDVDS